MSTDSGLRVSAINCRMNSRLGIAGSIRKTPLASYPASGAPDCPVTGRCHGVVVAIKPRLARALAMEVTLLSVTPDGLAVTAAP